MKAESFRVTVHAFAAQQLDDDTHSQRIPGYTYLYTLRTTRHRFPVTVPIPLSLTRGTAPQASSPVASAGSSGSISLQCTR